MNTDIIITAVAKPAIVTMEVPDYSDVIKETLANREERIAVSKVFKKTVDAASDNVIALIEKYITELFKSVDFGTFKKSIMKNDLPVRVRLKWGTRWGDDNVDYVTFEMFDNWFHETDIDFIKNADGVWRLRTAGLDKATAADFLARKWNGPCGLKEKLNKCIREIIGVYERDYKEELDESERKLRNLSNFTI